MIHRLQHQDRKRTPIQPSTEGLSGRSNLQLHHIKAQVHTHTIHTEPAGNETHVHPCQFEGDLTSGQVHPQTRLWIGKTPIYTQIEPSLQSHLTVSFSYTQSRIWRTQAERWGGREAETGAWLNLDVCVLGSKGRRVGRKRGNEAAIDR